MNTLYQNNSKYSTNKFFYGLWFLSLFLFTIDFFTIGSYCFLFIVILYTILHLREISFTVTEIFLFIFGAVYFLTLYRYVGLSFQLIFNFFIAPWLIYWLGRHITYNSNSNLILRSLIVLAIGFFFFILFSIIFSLSYAPPAAGHRVLYDFWDQDMLSVTVCGLLISTPLGVSFGILTSPKVKIWQRLLCLLVIGVCIYYSFTWAHRSTIIIIAILIFYNIFAYLNNTRATSTRKVFLIYVIVLAIIAVIFCFAFNICGCYTWLQGQWLYQRFTITDNSRGRFGIWISFFKQWLSYPFGGKAFALYGGTSFVHNLWLDAYYLCGMIPFIALFIATILIIKNILRYKKTLIQDGLQIENNILTNYFIAIFLNCMLEPVLEAHPYVFLVMLLISGMVAGALERRYESI